jgi:sarcosine oxidase
MNRDFDYIVIGLGGIGSAAAYWLSRSAGSKVLGLEQFELGHVRGESQDHSRIIRLSYHKPEYVEFAKQAYIAWKTLENDSKNEVILRTGGLDLWPPNAFIPMSDYIESLDACHVPYEIWNADEIRKWYPQFCIEDGTTGMFQSDAGIAAAARANFAHQKMARENGAILKEHTKVMSIFEKQGEYEVNLQDGFYRGRKLILTAGPWSNELLSKFDVELPLTITQEQVAYFVPNDLQEFAPDRFPIWIWMDEPSFYGFPVFGEAAVKAGQDVGGKEVTADSRTFDLDLDAFERLQKFMKKVLPSAMNKLLYTKSCLYTLTPDRDFVIDALPQNPNCFLAIGAGHAFKFASVIGKVLSELAMQGTTESNIDLFRLDRPILKEKNPHKSFLV